MFWSAPPPKSGGEGVIAPPPEAMALAKAITAQAAKSAGVPVAQLRAAGLPFKIQSVIQPTVMAAAANRPSPYPVPFGTLVSQASAAALEGQSVFILDP